MASEAKHKTPSFWAGWGGVMKVMFVCLGTGLLAKFGVEAIFAQADVETLVSKALAESPLIGTLVVVIWLFLKHLSVQRDDHKEIVERSLDTQEKQIVALQENTLMCEGIKSTLAENTRALDRSLMDRRDH